MSTVNSDKNSNKVTDQVSEEDLPDLKRRLRTEEENYDSIRKDPSLIAGKWSWRNLTIASMAAFIVVFVSSSFLAPLPSNSGIYSIFSSNLQYTLPLSISASIVPSIIYAVRHNFGLQARNSKLSATYSTISSLQNRITSLQQERAFTSLPAEGKEEDPMLEIRTELGRARVVLADILKTAKSKGKQDTITLDELGYPDQVRYLMTLLFSSFYDIKMHKDKFESKVQESIAMVSDDIDDVFNRVFDDRIKDSKNRVFELNELSKLIEDIKKVEDSIMNQTAGNKSKQQQFRKEYLDDKETD